MRVLVVEDDPGIIEVLDYALRREGHEVTCVSSGHEAVRRAGEAEFILLDVGLPDIDGFEVCRRIRRTLETPLMFLTSRSEEVDRVVGLELGGDDYLAKPFSTRELTARIKAVARRFERSAEPPSAGLSVDPATHRAAFQGKPLDLTRIEFALLSVLQAEPGRVFTRDQLLNRAWPDGGLVTDRTVDAHIKTLRKKLTNPDLIETVRGIGYRLREEAA